MGARPLRRVIEQYLEDPLAEKLLLNPGKGGSCLVTCEGDKLVFIDQEPPEADRKEQLALSGPEKKV